MRRAAAVLLAGLAAAGQAAEEGGPVSVRLSARPEQVTVGDPVQVAIEIAYPEGYEVAAVAPGPEWGAFRVAEVRPGEPRPRPDGGWVRVDSLRLAAYAPGAAEAPPLSIEFRAPDGSVGRVATASFAIPVVSVLGSETAAEIADLKDPASLKRPLWPWVLAAAALAAGAAGLAWHLHRRRRRLLAALAQRPQEPPLPPYEWALRQLAKIENSDLLAAGHWLDYHVLLAEVVKEYLTRRFAIATLERTTSEVLAGARGSGMASARVADLRSILEPCDLVKFARHTPVRQEAVEVMARARAFVEATRPAEPVQVQEAV